MCVYVCVCVCACGARVPVGEIEYRSMAYMANVALSLEKGNFLGKYMALWRKYVCVCVCVCVFEGNL